jgi:hypothetical protein
MDGTLIDTRTAVRMAYLRAGVVMPDIAWGKPWQEWLYDKEVHTRKNRAYAEMVLKFARALPLYWMAYQLKAPVLTGASRDAAAIVKTSFPGLHITLTDASALQKAEWLNAYMERGIYVDDCARTRLFVAERTLWKVISPKVCVELYLPLVLTRG